MQQDAEEAFTQLMWCLKKLTNSTNQNSNVVAELFEGEYQSTMKCLDAPDEPATHSTEKFEKLPCHITEAVNFLYDGLKQGLEEKIEKNSPSLQRTANYLKTFRISKLPFYLNVQFVRFFWKQQAKTKSKILRKVEFPFVLDVFDLCTEELQTKLQPERDRINKSKLEGTELIVDHSARDNRTGVYELVGVLSHKGRAADSGHYVAWIRQSQDENDWLLYDDDKVSSVTRDDIGKLTGALGDWHIAYLLLYRAKNYWRSCIKKNKVYFFFFLLIKTHVRQLLSMLREHHSQANARLSDFEFKHRCAWQLQWPNGHWCSWTCIEWAQGIQQDLHRAWWCKR